MKDSEKIIKEHYRNMGKKSAKAEFRTKEYYQYLQKKSVEARRLKKQQDEQQS